MSVRQGAGAFVAAVLALALAPAAARAGTPATTAADVCASNANPCNVTKVFDVAPNSVLDFGNRTVVVSGSGQFDFGSGSGRIACGTLSVSTTNPFLNAAGPQAMGGIGSGSVLVLARRRCNAGSRPIECLDGSDCQLGPCGVRRCSGRTTRTCNADADCQLGTCTSLRRCANLSTVRCTTNADCDYGSCPAQLTCSGRGDDPLACSTNSDCAFGSCSVGTGSMTIDGTITGSSERPATILLRAADSISILKPVNLNSTVVGADGGGLSVDARAGNVTIGGRLNLTGGGQSSGGTVEISAGTDVSIQSDIDVTGGDFDGGSADIAAGRDVTIRGSVLANSSAGAGFGGDIFVSAGRDLSFLGVSPSNKSTMEMNGHTDIENFAGDGGTLAMFADRNLLLDANTRLLGNGAAPDGTGADMELRSTANATADGDVVAKSLGLLGAGGYVTLHADGGTVGVGPLARFDLTGGSAGGGLLTVDSIGGDLFFAGDGDVSGGNGGGAGGAYLQARQEGQLSGALFSSGSGAGVLDVEACRLTLTGTAAVENDSDSGHNSLTTHDDMTLLSGSSVTALPTGSNTLRYRNATNPPVVQGTVSPSPQLVVDPSLTDCPLCGNRVLDAGESCDDGNAADGDGCSAECQNERCIAQTASPGYPAVALCEDGNVCTTDTCDAAASGGTCRHAPKDCSDGVACTIDSCDPDTGSCRHSANDAACSDTNVCTDDFCSPTMGCSNTANSSPCDDRNRCTVNDTCGSKTCRGTRVDGCLFCGDSFLNPLGGEQCDDGNDANGDCCSSTCRYEAASAPCEDTLFCTVGDRCNASGTCLSGSPNTCADTDACTVDSCDEELAACVHAGTPADASACFVAPRTKLQVKNVVNPAKDKLAWRWSAGDGFGIEELGTPDTDTDFTLCVYEQAAAGSSLKASIDIAPSSFWSSDGAMTWKYKDKAGNSDGVRKGQMEAGDAGRTDLRFAAGGTNLVVPAPSDGRLFGQQSSVVVQLRSEAGRCWTSRFAPADVRKSDPVTFKAETK